jgi:hypothetical protein
MSNNFNVVAFRAKSIQMQRYYLVAQVLFLFAAIGYGLLAYDIHQTRHELKAVSRSLETLQARP